MNRILSLSAAFMQNIITNFDTDIIGVATDVEDYFKKQKHKLIPLIVKHLDTICQSQKRCSPYANSIEMEIADIKKETKPYEKIHKLEALLAYIQTLPTFNISDKKLDELKENLAIVDSTPIKTCLSEPTLRRCCTYTQPLKIDRHHIETFLIGFVLQDIKDRKKLANLLKNLKDPNLFFQVKESDGSVVAEYPPEDRDSIEKDLFETIDECIGNGDRPDHINFYELLTVLFRQLRIQDQKAKKGSKAVKSANTRPIIKSAQVPARDIDIEKIIQGFYKDLIPEIPPETSGKLNEEMLDIMAYAVSMSKGDIEFVMESAKIGINKIVDSPNVKALILYRYYQALMAQSANTGEINEFLDNLVWYLFDICRREFHVFIHPKSNIKFPAYIGQNVHIMRNTHIGQKCVVGDNVLIEPHAEDNRLPCRIGIGHSCLLSNNSKLLGCFSLNNFTIIEEGHMIYDEVPSASKEDALKRIEDHMNSMCKED